MLLYNSLSQKKEVFSSRNPKKISLYVCGITPYDTTHLGHAFLYMFFDALIRYLRFKNYTVTYVQNVTDIDDDIIKRAKQEKKDWKALGEFWTHKFLNDLQALYIRMPDHYVKATDSIPTIISIVSSLVVHGHAYEKNGNVYFNVKRFPDYGKLSHFSKEQMLLIAHERGADIHDPKKKDPLDFILWQKSNEGEPFWQSPWGKGRPGWHIECSAMIHQYLGNQVDIHGGGRDLIYPHHESEIAQSESYMGKSPFVKYWLHAAMVMYQGEKMSKSLGNLIMVSDSLKKYSANAIRFVLLSHHYRSPWEFHEEELQHAEKNLTALVKLAKSVKADKKEKNIYFQKFTAFLEDDFQTDKALYYLVSLIHRSQDTKKAATIASALDILGFTL